MDSWYFWAIGTRSTPISTPKSPRATMRDCDLSIIAARALATYLIPGCVGRGVRLGSENSSATATAAVGGVWKSGNLEIWDFGNLEIWGPGNPEILRFGDLEIQKIGVQQSKE